VCHMENFSPQSMMCRLAGAADFGYQRIAVIGGVIILAALANLALRHEPGRSWEVFAFACLLSPMISPIAWSHYQVMLLPMFLLLAIQLTEQRGPWTLWAGLLGALCLAELVWRPAMSLPGALDSVFGGGAEDIQSSFRVMSIAMFSQYLLYMTALVWFIIRGTPLAKRLRLESSTKGSGALRQLASSTRSQLTSHPEETADADSLDAGRGVGRSD
jgi:hypothetical protein